MFKKDDAWNMDNEIKMVCVKKYNFLFLVGFTKLRKN
jgi:hypothetical protein